MRSFPLVVAFLSTSACGGTVGTPSPGEEGPIPTRPETVFDASAPPQDAATRADAAVAAPVDAAPDAIALDAACEYPLTGYTLPDLDTKCFDGPTGRQVLALLAPSYASTFVPSGPPYGRTWTGSLTPSPLTITVAYTAGTITCKPYPPDCDLNPPEVTTCPCPEGGAYGSFDIELAVTFQTADGSFDEQLSATASVSTFTPESVTWVATLPVADLHAPIPPVFLAQQTFHFQGALAPIASLSGTIVETSGQLTGGGGTWGE